MGGRAVPVSTCVAGGAAQAASSSMIEPSPMRVVTAIKIGNGILMNRHALANRRSRLPRRSVRLRSELSVGAFRLPNLAVLQADSKVQHKRVGCPDRARLNATHSRRRPRDEP